MHTFSPFLQYFTFSAKHSIFHTLTPGQLDLPLVFSQTELTIHLLSWLFVVLSAYKKYRDVPGRITGFLPRWQFLYSSLGQEGLIYLPTCITTSCLYRLLTLDLQLPRMGPLVWVHQSKPIFCILTLLQKREILWCKLPLGTTSCSSTALFLYDVEENLMFQVVMPLINLP